MILRFKLFSAAGAAALLATPGSDAFTPAALHGTIASSRAAAATTTARGAGLNPDWDNDDFLSSLGGGQEEREKANEKYLKQAENRRAMDEWRGRKFAEQQQQQSNSATQGGGPSPDLLKKMGVKSEPAQVQPPPPQMSQPPQQQMQPPPQQQPAPQQQFFDANGNPVSMPMVYDQNGNLVPFAQQTQQQPPQQQPPAQQLPQMAQTPALIEPPLPPKTKGTDSPRPVGFNPDAYTMSNTADVYFAQLKQDSKVRKIARMSGDVETANRVFADESVREIGESWNENPYTKEKNLAEARAEIEGTVRAQTMEDEIPEVATGISYKEKLQQMKAKRMGGTGAPAKATAAQQPPPPKVEPPIAVAPPKVEVQPKVVQPVTSVPPVPSAVMPAAAAQQPKAAASSSSPEPPEEVRGKVRTLQGLLLKHRGGPGFGAGRLRAPEAQRLEDTLEEVKGILRSEIGKWDAKPVAEAPAAQTEETKPAEAPKVVTAVPPPPPQQKATKAPAVPAPAVAATMVSQSAVVGVPDPLAGSVACVEAALKMYKESSPADREAMMIPLREALMAAASASNKYIAESELRAHNEAMSVGPPAAVDVTKPAMGFPTSYAVTKPEEDGVKPVVNTASTAVATAAIADQAENERKLEDAYTALLQAGGKGGKLGLKNISGDEANALADKLVAMRGVLLDELNSS